jgi:hypothetical protein
MLKHGPKDEVAKTEILTAPRGTKCARCQKPKNARAQVNGEPLCIGHIKSVHGIHVNGA